MMQNTYITETDAKYTKLQSYKAIIITFVILSLLACLGILVAWQTFIYFEGIVLLSFIVVIALVKHNKHFAYELHFENNHLCIKNRVTGESFEVYDIPASDFVITQTKKDKAVNYCNLEIKNTVFAFRGIKKCSELKEYISENYK